MSAQPRHRLPPPIKIGKLVEHVRLIARDAITGARLVMGAAIRLDDLLKDLDVEHDHGRELDEDREIMHVQPSPPTRATKEVQGDDKSIDAWVAPPSSPPPPPSSNAKSLPPLDLVEDRTPEQMTADGDSRSPAQLKRGARSILEVLVSVGTPLTRTRVATLTGLSKTSGSFSTYLSELRTRGLVVDEGDMLRATEKGQIETGTVTKTSEEEIRAMWNAKLGKGAREILAALRSMHPRALSRTQLATLAGLSPSSGSYATYLSTLRSNALIEEGVMLRLTAEGLIVAGPKTKPPTTEQLLERWTSKLQGAARTMLEVLVDVYPKSMTYAELGAAVKVNPRSGSFSTYLSKLRSNELISTDKGSACASPVFGGE